MEDSNVVFNFDDQVEKDTFHHLIALGEKANRVLKHLKLDLGNWFAEDLLTIEKGYEKVKYLLVLADDNVDISNLPKEYSDEKMGQLQKSVDALGGGLTKIYCQVVYEERNKVCTFAT